MFSAFLSACSDADIKDDTATVGGKMPAVPAVAVNGGILDSAGNKTAAYNNEQFVFFGTEVDQWKTKNNDQTFFDEYIEGHRVYKR